MAKPDGEEVIADWLLRGSCVESFRVTAPLVCLYRLLPGGEADATAAPFNQNPLGSQGAPLLGPPIVLDAAGGFFGLLGDDGQEACRFAYDGRCELRIRIPVGQRLLVGRQGEATWRRYNRRVMQAHGWRGDVVRPAWWQLPEYMVEAPTRTVGTSFSRLPVGYDDVVAFLQRLRAAGLPPGKLILGHGWLGAARDAATELRRTVAAIVEAGFVAGVRVAPAWEATRPGEIAADFDEHFARLVAWLISGGIRKLRLDINSHQRLVLTELHRRMYRIVKELAPETMVEIGHPDTFLSRHADSVRITDIPREPAADWPDRARRTQALWARCAPGCCLNLGAIGEASDVESATEWRTRLQVMSEAAIGYPTVSLPDDSWPGAMEALHTCLDHFLARGQACSTFYAQDDE